MLHVNKNLIDSIIRAVHHLKIEEQAYFRKRNVATIYTCKNKKLVKQMWGQNCDIEELLHE